MDFDKIINFAQGLNCTRESISILYEYLLRTFDLENPLQRSQLKKGVLIIFDGHSGAGKDVQMQLLIDQMKENPLYKGYNLVSLVQKRGDPFRFVSKHLWAKYPNDSQVCSLLLLTAGRRYFVETAVLPQLENPNTILVQNRSYLSTIAYHARDISELPDLLDMPDFDPKADLPFVLECDANMAFSRVIKRSPEKGGVIYPNERPEFIERVKRNFRYLDLLINGLIFIDTSSEATVASAQIKSRTDDFFRGRSKK